MKKINFRTIYKIKDKFIDLFYDHKYGIKTCGAKEFDRRVVNFGYRPTPYIKLHKMFRKYPINKDNHLVDYGCGKGRVLFAAAKNGCKKATGIELNEDMYVATTLNINRFQNKYDQLKTKIEVINIDAVKFEIKPSMTDFFFYNPFHMKVFIYVLKNVEKSIIDHPRNIRIFLYHPHESYLWLLDKTPSFALVEKSRKYSYVIYDNKETNNIN